MRGPGRAQHRAPQRQIPPVFRRLQQRWRVGAASRALAPDPVCCVAVPRRADGHHGGENFGRRHRGLLAHRPW